MADYFFWCGVVVNVIGAAAVCGLLAWQAIEMWIKFNDIRKPFLQWYWTELRKKKDPTHD